MKGKGEIRTYWLVGHKEGPKPRLKKHFEDLKVDSPWLSKDASKSRPHITFFDEDMVSSARKGSLVPFDKTSAPSNTTSLYKKTLAGRSALANSILRLKSSYSNSCSTVGLSVNPEAAAETRISPKPSRRNWNFKFFNGKIRSMSTHHPGDAPLNHISMKESKSPSICKSPSYNTIESLNQRINTELGNYEDTNGPSPNSLTRSQLDGSLIEESSLTEVPDEEKSNQFTLYKSDESADEYGEDRPLLAADIFRSQNNHDSNRQVNDLAEEDDSFVNGLSQVQAIVHSPPDQFEGLLVVSQNGNSQSLSSFPHSNCDTSPSEKHFNSSPMANGPNISVDSAEKRAYYVALQDDAISIESEPSVDLPVVSSTSPNEHRSLAQPHHNSNGNDFVCLELSSSPNEPFYYQNHLVSSSSPASHSTPNGASMKIKSTV